MDTARRERILDRQGLVMTRLLEETKRSVARGVPADAHLSQFYRAHPEYGSRDRRLFSATVFAYFRWKGWIAPLASSDAAACVYASLLDQPEVDPAVQRLALQAGIPESHLTPLGSLDLAAKAATLGRHAGTEPLPLHALVPEWVPALLGDAAATTIAAFQNPPPTWLRCAPPERDALIAGLAQIGADPRPHPRLASAIAVSRGSALRSLAREQRDRFEIQDLSSQAAGLACRPAPGEAWWDACCGAGGKTLHLAELGGRSLPLLATDIRPSILQELERRVARLPRTGIRTAAWDGSEGRAPAGRFDGVLLDAPCSGSGTWHRNPDARWRMTLADVHTRAALQQQLLTVCAGRVKPGGLLVYVTCSLFRLENEDIVDRFLDGTPGFALEPMPHPLTGAPTPGRLLITPDAHQCNGLFVARLRKT